MSSGRGGRWSMVGGSAGARAVALVSSWVLASPGVADALTAGSSLERPWLEVRLDAGLVKIDGERVAATEEAQGVVDDGAAHVRTVGRAHLNPSGRLEYFSGAANGPIVVGYRVEGGTLRLSFRGPRGALVDGSPRAFPTDVVLGHEPRRVTLLQVGPQGDGQAEVVFGFRSLAPPVRVPVPEPSTGEQDEMARDWLRDPEHFTLNNYYLRVAERLRALRASQRVWQLLDHRAISDAEHGIPIILGCEHLAWLRRRSPWYAGHPLVRIAAARDCSSGAQGFATLEPDAHAVQ